MALTNKMIKPKRKLGIISGAGPMAGVLMLRYLFKAYQQQGAWQDKHFPFVKLINYPFSDMLSPDYSYQQIQNELMTNINSLSKDCDLIIVTCQTLHLFLPKCFSNPKFMSIFDILKANLPTGKLYVAASKTSASSRIHQALLGRPCDYIEPERTQRLIDSLLKGEPVDFSWLEAMAKTKPVLLGCTELSLPFEHSKTNCIDPYPIIIKTLIELLAIERTEEVLS